MEEKEHARTFDTTVLKAAGVSFIAGVLALFAVRFIVYKPSEVHYHANFAVFVDGERLPFDRFSFYEEIEACGGSSVTSPKIRVHMHEQINHVAHVHDNGVTWGHFFANLGFTDGDTVFRTDAETYVESAAAEIHFVLNGEEVDTTANRTIGDEDVLLVSIGQPSEDELQQQYSQIERDAHVYNENDDPSACSGNAERTTMERLKHATGLVNE